MAKIYKLLFIVHLVAGFMVVGIGLYLYVNHKVEGEKIFDPEGRMNYGALNGASTIIMGILILLFTKRTYGMYKSESKYTPSEK